MASPVKVFIYDISRGLAAQLSEPILGKKLEGVWHTGVVVYGKEYFFGSMGIEWCPPGGTMLGQPDKVAELGDTEIPEELFNQYLIGLKDTFSPQHYHLLDHNCNNFSAEVALFLTGKNIPDYITNLPDEVMSTPFGAMIRPMLDSMSAHPIETSQTQTGSMSSPLQSATSATPTQPSNETSKPMKGKAKPAAEKGSGNEGGKQDKGKTISDNKPKDWSNDQISLALRSVKDGAGQVKLTEDERALVERLELHTTGSNQEPFPEQAVTLIGRLLQLATSKSSDKSEAKEAAIAALKLLTVAVHSQQGFQHYSQKTDHLVFRFCRSCGRMKDQSIDEAVVNLLINLCHVDKGSYLTSTHLWRVSPTITTSNLQEAVTVIVDGLTGQNTSCQLHASRLLFNISLHEVSLILILVCGCLATILL
jgi:hypothetical protein